MLTELEKFFLRNYKPLNLIEISRKSLIANYRYLSSFGLKIAPVLKSNAYGHGLLPVARVLDGLKVPFFCVDSLYEAYELHKANIRTPILVMGYVSPESLMTKHLPFSYALYTRTQLWVLKKYQPESSVHLFVDTGMRREGFQLEELGKIIFEIKKTKVRIEGLMSHFAESESPNNNKTILQERKFEEAMDMLKKLGVSPQFVHIANSSGILNSKKLTCLGNTARAGIALYGIDPMFHNNKLKPVLSFKTKIAQIKEIKKGEFVGYNFTFKAKNDMRLAILPAGYNDGIDRKLSNKGIVKVRGVVCPIVGVVSMNITTIDISKVVKAKEEEEVLVYSSKREDNNSIANVVKLTNTLPYELLVHLNETTKRIVV